MNKRKRIRKLYSRFIKRMLDIILSSALLIFLLLPLFLIAVVIRADSKGNAIFKQKRVGKGGRVFVCYKLRTMYVGTPSVASASFPDKGNYITRVGRILRRTSLDELPQLYNVLKGDMSLIGPRPLICEEKELHTQRMDKGVYSLRPGMTGMAQINGRNSLNDDEKLLSDEYYLKNLRFLLDAKIFFKTFVKLLHGEEPSAKEGRRAKY